MSAPARPELVPGERYLVVIDDCCVTGAFTAAFVAWDGPFEGGDERNGTAHFDNGVALHGVGWSAEHVGEGDDVALRLLESVDL